MSMYNWTVWTTVYISRSRWMSTDVYEWRTMCWTTMSMCSWLRWAQLWTSCLQHAMFEWWSMYWTRSMCLSLWILWTILRGRSSCGTMLYQGRRQHVPRTTERCEMLKIFMLLNRGCRLGNPLQPLPSQQGMSRWFPQKPKDRQV